MTSSSEFLRRVEIFVRASSGRQLSFMRPRVSMWTSWEAAIVQSPTRPLSLLVASSLSSLFFFLLCALARNASFLFLV